MTSPPIFSKTKDRYNTLASRTITLRIKIFTKRSNIDKMTIGELKNTKKEINHNLLSLSVKELAKPIFENIKRKHFKITVELV